MQLQYGMSSSLPPPSEYLPAKSRVDQIIADANISSKSFATSPVSHAKESRQLFLYRVIVSRFIKLGKQIRLYPMSSGGILVLHWEQ